MRLRNARGEGTEEEAGSEATQGDRNCGEVVAFAISSAEPGSGLSCATGVAHAEREGEKREPTDAAH